jgi:PEP-CTERM motif
MRASVQTALSLMFLTLTTAPAQADLIRYSMFGSVGELDPVEGQILISAGIHEGDPAHLFVHVDSEAPDLCDQPGKGLYFLPLAALDVNGIHFGDSVGYVEVNNAAGNCAGPGDDHTGVTERLLVGPVGITFFGDEHVGESLPDPLFSLDGVSGYFGLVSGSVGEVSFDEIRIVPEPATLLLVSSGLVAVAMRKRRRRARLPNEI